MSNSAILPVEKSTEGAAPAPASATAPAAAPAAIAIGTNGSAAPPLKPETGSAPGSKANSPAGHTLGKGTSKAKLEGKAGLAEGTGKKKKKKRKDDWKSKMTKDAPGLLISLGAHVLVLFGLTMVALPTKDREMIVGAILGTVDGDTNSDSTLDTNEILPDKIETTAPADTALSSPMVASTSTAEVNVSDLDPRTTVDNMEAPGGVGSGPGPFKFEGALGGRSKAGKAALVARGGGNLSSEKAVNTGLKWLAKQQNSDGSWSFADADKENKAALKNTTGATGLALLAFLGGGHTHKKGQGDFQKTVQKGLDYLLSQMEVKEDGGKLFGKDYGHGPMYIQGIATLALCEAYALTHDRKLFRPTQLAVDFIVHAQDPKGGGWRYQPQQKGDTSVTGWEIQALKSAQLTRKLKVPAATIGKSTFYLNSVQAEGGAKYGYEAPGATPSMTAVGLLCRMYLGWTPKTPALQKGVEFIGQVGPSPGDLYYNYYATQVMHHWGGDLWTKWNSVMRDRLVKSQIQEGDDAGSWKPGGDHGAGPGGRLYQTCLSVMTLEVYYRHLPLYQREKMSAEF